MKKLNYYKKNLKNIMICKFNIKLNNILLKLMMNLEMKFLQLYCLNK